MLRVFDPGRVAVRWFLLSSLPVLPLCIAFRNPIATANEPQAPAPTERGAADSADFPFGTEDDPDYVAVVNRMTELIERNPKRGKLYAARAYAWGELGQAARATADFEEAIRLAPKEAAIYSMRGMFQVRSGDREGALKSLTEALRLSPSEREVHVSRSMLWNLKQEFGNAIDDATTAIGLDPTCAQAFTCRGFARRHQGQMEAALADFDAAIRLERGNIRSANKDFDGAIVDYTEAIRIDPESTSPLIGRAAALSARGRFDDALRDTNEMIRLRPKNASFAKARAWVWTQKREYANAIEDLALAIRLEPTNPIYHEDMAWIRAACPDARFRDAREALTHATKACDLSAWKYRDALDALAAAHAESGDFSNAVKYEEQAISLGSESVEKQRMRDRLALYKAGEPFRFH